MHRTVGKVRIAAVLPDGRGRRAVDINAFGDGFQTAMPWLSIVRRILAYRWLQPSAVRAIQTIDRLLNKRLAQPNTAIDLFD